MDFNVETILELDSSVHLRAQAGDQSAVAVPKISPQISIVIPTLNEKRHIQILVDMLASLRSVEVIFSDGGSADGTLQKIQDALEVRDTVRLVQSSCSRSIQMNAGAAIARGEWLIFLHADTILSSESFERFRTLVRGRGNIQSGSFTFRVEHKRWVYRYLEFYVKFRSSVMKLPYGDQAIFVRRSLFEQLGGYRMDYPLMEDVELVQRLNKLPGFAVIDAPVFTSARRFEADGYLRRTLGNLYLQFLYSIGKHPRELARRYYTHSS